MTMTSNPATVKVWPVITLDSHQGGKRNGRVFHWTHESPWLATALNLHAGMEVVVQEVQDPDECRWLGTLTDLKFVRGERRDYVRLEIEEGEWLGPRPIHA